MGRAAKDVVEYFPFMVNAINRMPEKLLLRKFGCDGFTILYVLRGALGQAEGHYLDLSDDENYDAQAADCYTDEAIFGQVVDYLADRAHVDPVLWRDHRIIWMPGFVESLWAVYNKRGRALPVKPKPGDVSDGEVGENDIPATEKGDTGTEKAVTGAGMPHSIVKDSNSIAYSKGGSGGERGAASSAVAQNYKNKVGDYFDSDKMKPGGDVYCSLVDDFPGIDLDGQLLKARGWLLENVSKSKRRGGRAGDFGSWLRGTWLKNAVAGVLPDGVPTFEVFYLEVVNYADSGEAGKAYDSALMCKWTKYVFEKLVRGLDGFNAIGPAYLRKSLKDQYDSAVTLTREKKK